jgi:hypothetical protein
LSRQHTHRHLGTQQLGGHGAPNAASTTDDEHWKNGTAQHTGWYASRVYQDSDVFPKFASPAETFC